MTVRLRIQLQLILARCATVVPLVSQQAARALQCSWFLNLNRFWEISLSPAQASLPGRQASVDDIYINKPPLGVDATATDCMSGVRTTSARWPTGQLDKVARDDGRRDQSSSCTEAIWGRELIIDRPAFINNVSSRLGSDVRLSPYILFDTGSSLHMDAKMHVGQASEAFTSLRCTQDFRTPLSLLNDGRQGVECCRSF